MAEGKGGADCEEPPVGKSASSGVESIYVTKLKLPRGFGRIRDSVPVTFPVNFVDRVHKLISRHSRNNIF